MRPVIRVCTIATLSATAITVTPASAQCLTGNAIAFDAASGDQFGSSVAISDQRCIIGSKLDDAGPINCGSAYIYKYDDLTCQWVLEAKLVAGDAQASDEFGFSVAMHSSPVTGDLAIIGARHDDDKGVDSGSAYIFKRNGSIWTQVAKLLAADGVAGDRFGFAVAISGNEALVSARDDDAPLTNTGSVYAFHFNGSAWTQSVKLVPSDVAQNDQFGHSISMAMNFNDEGAIAIIGSWHDDAPSANCGSAYVYRLNPRTSGWSQSAKLTASDSASNDEFGFAVAISSTINGDRVVVSARNNDDDGTNSGAAYVFGGVGASWSQQFKLLAGDSAAGDQFGQSVTISPKGESIIIGANSNDQNGTDAGAAYLFTQPVFDSEWLQTSKFVAASGTPGDLFGTSVAASATRAIVGSHLNDAAGADAGAVYFYAGIEVGDLDGDGIPNSCDVPGDVTGDGQVNTFDLVALFEQWGTCPDQPEVCAGDLDGNGNVDVNDLLIVISNWG